MWFAPRWLAAHAAAVPHLGGLEALLWVASCVASCFGFMALFRGVRLPPQPWMSSLTRSAYVIYLVHYVFIAWLQCLTLDRPIDPRIKCLFLFLATTLLSWLTAQVLLRIPKLRAIL
jgi:glucans biosynthesis protein C